MTTTGYIQLIRAMMASKGWNLRDLAFHAGYSYEHLRAVLAGTKLPSRTMHEVLCARLGLPIEETWSLVDRRAVRQPAAIERRHRGRVVAPACPRCQSVTQMEVVARTSSAIYFRCTTCVEVVAQAKPARRKLASS